ncbi:unnamed protein product [Nezara viridula]|uniref:Uncharacterized protein n=1 Tax=Nezara viridula TaxID=85310 RepID=A0A9P0MF10_NEZVI|nr:unnamed protein product [Nezara viridula]
MVFIERFCLIDEKIFTIEENFNRQTF